MRVLGIDPGSRITGYGIIEKIGNRLVHVDNGAIHTDSHREFALRLHAISRGCAASSQSTDPMPWLWSRCSSPITPRAP